MRLKRTGQDGAAYLLYFVSGSFYGCACLHSLTIIYTHTHPLADESQCKLFHFPACVCDFVEDIWKFRHYLEWKRTWIERHHDSSDFHMWLHFYLFFAVVLRSLRTHVTHTHTPHALTAVIRPLIFPSLPGFPGFLGVISNRAAPTSRGSCSSLCGSP